MLLTVNWPDRQRAFILEPGAALIHCVDPTNGTFLSLCAMTLSWEAASVKQLQLQSHVKAGLDEKGVFGLWGPVLGFSQKKIHQEEQSRSVGATRCGQRVSAVQVREEFTHINLLIWLREIYV